MSRCPTPRPSVQLLWGNRQPITALASEPAGTRLSARPRNAFVCNSQPELCKSVKKFRTRADVVIFTVTGQLFKKKIRLELEGRCTRHVSPLIMTTGPIYQAGTQRSDAAGGVTIICCIRTLLFDSGSDASESRCRVRWKALSWLDAWKRALLYAVLALACFARLPTVWLTAVPGLFRTTTPPVAWPGHPAGRSRHWRRLGGAQAPQWPGKKNFFC